MFDRMIFRGHLTRFFVPGAIHSFLDIGAAAAIRATDTRVRAAVAGFLGLVAIVYAIGEIRALAG